MNDLFQSRSLNEWIREFPMTLDFLSNLRLNDIEKELTLVQAVDQEKEMLLDDFGFEPEDVYAEFKQFLDSFAQENSGLSSIRSLTIFGGHNKNGEKEALSLKIQTGEVISIVGPTGSGKSRLLADIECLAQGDTPTGRLIQINDAPVTESMRYDMEGKLVAQLSQNMNFVMDLTVRDFLFMHARSRFVENLEETIQKCYACAIELAGEPFSQDVKVTQLSGGQSRALMIADTACMSLSPIVLIDEIENAGINRREAVELLSKEEKIILIATHDPLLALGAHKRLIIRNGGIEKIIAASEAEKVSLRDIERLDSQLMAVRNRLRNGEIIDSIGG